VEAELHPDVVALAPLLGSWSGEGSGQYPTIEPFDYRETVDFRHVGKPFLAYQQRTVRLDTGMPAHSEMGYLRGIGEGRVELVLAHPTGLAELAAGSVEPTADGLRLALLTTEVARTSTAKDVRTVERVLLITGDTLTYDLAMAAVGEPLTHHLHATLHRTD